MFLQTTSADPQIRSPLFTHGQVGKGHAKLCRRGRQRLYSFATVAAAETLSLRNRDGGVLTGGESDSIDVSK